MCERAHGFGASGFTIDPHPHNVYQSNMTIKDLTTAQLQKIINIKQQIEDLEQELDSIGGDSEAPKRRGRPPGAKLGRPPGRPKGRKMSAAGRKAIAEAAKKRWAAFRKEKPGKTEKPAEAKKKRKMSAAGRAKIAAAARERWKKAKAEGKKSL